MSDLIKIENHVFPFQFVNEKLIYSESQNMFVTTGYTSFARNTYFSGFRFSDRIIIMFNIGIGYYYTFLNGLSVFTFQNDQKACIGSMNYHKHRYNEQTIKKDAKTILKNKILGKAAENKLVLDDLWLSQSVNLLVEGPYKNPKKTIQTIQANRLLP